MRRLTEKDRHPPCRLQWRGTETLEPSAEVRRTRCHSAARPCTEGVTALTEIPQLCSSSSGEISPERVQRKEHRRGQPVQGDQPTNVGEALRLSTEDDGLIWPNPRSPAAPPAIEQADARSPGHAMPGGPPEAALPTPVR